MLGGGGVKHGLRGSPALCSGRGGRSLQRLLTGIGICERALWESLAVRDQLWRDVPTTPTGVAKVGARGGHVAKRARAAHAAIMRVQHQTRIVFSSTVADPSQLYDSRTRGSMRMLAT
jgi:hypothetical protein